jgi:hypothetical protein
MEFVIRSACFLTGCIVAGPEERNCVVAVPVAAAGIRDLS